jgi:undecaprenyl pyrophosphate phosphatase UppP
LHGGLDPVLVTGIVTAAVVGVASIRVLFAWVRTRSYLPFVVYRFAFSAFVVMVWLARR